MYRGLFREFFRLEYGALWLLGCLGWGRSSDCSGGFIGGTALVWAGVLGLLGVCCPLGVEEGELFAQETYHSQHFRYETLGTPLLKVCPSYFISFESHKRLKVHFCHFYSSENE